MFHRLSGHVQDAWMKFKLLRGRMFAPGSQSTHRYDNYGQYTRHQIEKTADPQRIARWLGPEWDVKVQGFSEIFQSYAGQLQGKQNAICLGSRVGQEVKALRDMGLQAIGVDLVPFAPYTVQGDIHDLKYPDASFDLIFTNIFDHALYPEVFCREMRRLCRPQGLILLRLQLGDIADDYTETLIRHPQHVLDMFGSSVRVLDSHRLNKPFDGMNWQLLLTPAIDQTRETRQ